MSKEKEWKAEQMAKLRTHIEGRFDKEWKNESAIKCFGILLFQSGFSKRELEWILEKKYMFLLNQIKQTNHQGEVFSYFNQALKSITSEVKEQRFYKREGSGTTELDKIIDEAF